MLDLKDILSSVISNAERRYSQKIAEDMSRTTNESKAIKRELSQETKEEKVHEGASVEKVASAIEYIVDNFEDFMPKSPLARALDKVANMPGEGAGSLSVSQASKKRVDYAKKDKMSETEDPSTAKTQKGPQGEVATNETKRPGGALLKKELYINEPSGTSKEAAWAAVLSKMAGEDVLKAKISSGSAKSTEMKTWEAPDSPGTPMGHDQSGYGNENEKLIMSNDSARNYTKRDAKKEYVKKQLSQAFDEANPEKDTTLDRAWTRGRDTAKMAGMQEAKAIERLAKKEEAEEREEEQLAPGIHAKLQKKLAQAVEEGCKCGGDGSCDYCKAKNAVMKKLAFFKKRAAIEGAPGAAAGPATPDGEDPAVAMQNAAAGGMKPGMQPPPDCMCQGQGICPACKKQQLAMILAKAKMQGASQDSPGPGATQPVASAGMMPQDQPVSM